MQQTATHAGKRRLTPAFYGAIYPEDIYLARIIGTEVRKFVKQQKI